MRHARGAYDWRVSRSTTRRSGRSVRPLHIPCGMAAGFSIVCAGALVQVQGREMQTFIPCSNPACDEGLETLKHQFGTASARGAAGRVATGARAPTPVFDGGDQPFSCDSTLRTICASGLLSADWGANLIWANVTAAKPTTTRAADAAMRGMYFTETSFRGVGRNGRS